jgi:hypothetical protein
MLLKLILGYLIFAALGYAWFHFGRKRRDKQWESDKVDAALSQCWRDEMKEKR